MSEPTTEADDDLVDAFFSLGLTMEEIKEHWLQVQPLLEVAAASEHQRVGASGLQSGLYGDDMLNSPPHRR